MNHNQVKCQRSRISNEQQSSEMSKVKDIQWTTIKWHIKGQGYAMNHDQVKYQVPRGDYKTTDRKQGASVEI